MKSFMQFLSESPDLSVDLHLAGHFGSGKTTALERSGIGKHTTIIDLDDIDQEMMGIHGQKPSESEPLKVWHKKFGEAYTRKVLQAKQAGKPIVVVGHHYEDGRRVAPIEARQKIYINIPKDKLFAQRKARDADPGLTDEYLEAEHASVQSELDNENYVGMSFGDAVNALRNTEHSGLQRTAIVGSDGV